MTACNDEAAKVKLPKRNGRLTDGWSNYETFKDFSPLRRGRQWREVTNRASSNYQESFLPSPASSPSSSERRTVKRAQPTPHSQTWRRHGKITCFFLALIGLAPLHAVTTRHTLKAFGYTIIAKLITSYTQGHTVDTHVRRHCARLHGTCNVHPNWFTIHLPSTYPQPSFIEFSQILVLSY